MKKFLLQMIRSVEYCQIPRFIGASCLFLGVWGVFGCRGQKSELPPVHPNPNMDSQRRVDPQEKWSVTVDGKPDSKPIFEHMQGMRLPVAGTIARGEYSLDQAFTMGKSLDDTYLAEFPAAFMVNMEAMKKGERKFNTYCAPCHGLLGDGKGTVAALGYPPVTDLHEDRIRTMSTGQIFSEISNGIRNMPGYATLMSQEERWSVVLYLRALQRSQNAKIEDVPEAQKAQLK